jgi:hypothetical protein
MNLIAAEPVRWGWRLVGYSRREAPTGPGSRQLESRQAVELKGLGAEQRET